MRGTEEVDSSTLMPQAPTYQTSSYFFDWLSGMHEVWIQHVGSKTKVDASDTNTPPAYDADTAKEKSVDHNNRSFLASSIIL